MTNKVNPWLDEGNRYNDEDGGGKRQKIRDLKFFDNTTHTVRILSSKKAGEFPFHGYKQHWIPQNGSQTGRPITHRIDERCPVCEWLSIQWNEVHRLKEEEDMTDKSPEVEALLNKISKVSAKTRYDMNVIHREDPFLEDEETKEKVLTPKRMSTGATVYKEIFSFAKKWGSPSSEDTGYDLEISTSGAKERREYRTIPDRNGSPLTTEEKALISKTYDLKELRKNSTHSEIIKVLENARTPYNDIIQYIAEDTAVREPITTEKNVKKDVVSEVVNEIEDKIKKPEVTQDTEKKLESDVITEQTTIDDEHKTTIDDEHNIEIYECKGDYDENDKMCSDCPVKNTCEDVHPFYVKAKQMKIDIDPHRTTKEIVEEVKKTETTETTETTEKKVIKKRNKIPF